jgi:hypothetical protein
VGLIVNDLAVVRGIQQIFEEDWALTPSGRKVAAQDEPRGESQAEVPAEQPAMAG